MTVRTSPCRGTAPREDTHKSAPSWNDGFVQAVWPELIRRLVVWEQAVPEPFELGARETGGHGSEGPRETVAEPPTVDSDDDAAIAARAAQGDTAAFEILLDRYAARVYRLALRMVGDRGEAEDITQEVLITAWRRIGELTEPGAVRTWLFRIAHRRCLLVLRTQKKRRTDVAEVLPSGQLVGASESFAAADPQRVAEADAMADALPRALLELPPQQRAVWLLAEIDGLSYVDIATVVGVSEQAVRGRLSRARAKLAGVMSAWR